MEIFREKIGSNRGLKGFGELEKGILQGKSGENRSAEGGEGQSWQGRLVWLGLRG